MKTSFSFLHMSTMGLLLFIIVFSIRSHANGNASWTNEERDAIRSRQSPLPLQAVVCDSVGVGVVKELSTHQWGETVRIEVDHYWVGNPGSNTLNISANRTQLSVTNTPIVFFSTRYTLPRHYSGGERLFSLLYKMPLFWQENEPRDP